MIGTNYSTGGIHRITQLAPPVKLRFAGFILVVVCGTAMVTWITRATWAQLERLQKEHAAVRSESFYLGVTLRSSIRSLNGKLLQFGISRDAAVRETFAKEAAELQGLMNSNRIHLAEISDMRLVRRLGAPNDLELLRQVQKSFTNYLARTDAVLTFSKPPPELDTFQEVYGRVQAASKDLLAHCDQLVAVQRETFGQFLAGTQDTLGDHKRLLQSTMALIVGLAGALAVLVYRGMIAPLRLGLTQSKTIIERQEKLASLGVLASGVAHEIRNPLTAIKFRLFSLKNTVPSLAGNEDATTIANEINRLERIVKDFLKFARPSAPELAPLPAEQILTEARDFFKGQAERLGIVLKVEALAAARVHADAQQMKQVLINLIQNAVEAIGRNGVITLSVRGGAAELEGRTRPAAILSVADTGKGIPPEVEARLFDPFFTTKEGGTGLGLAISARIIEKHGGMLRYKTELNQGTKFEIVLPRLEDDTSATTTH